MTVYEKIAAQQKGKEYTDVWGVGEQLKDILRSDPSLEEIVSQDLDVKEMSLTAAAKKIKAWADEKHMVSGGKSICVPPSIAEGIIREFYGLPDAGAAAQAPVEQCPVQVEDVPLDFADFL